MTTQTSRHDSDRALADQEPSLFSELSARYRDVMFSSLVNSFGLDALLFQNDERGGHVDTLHGVTERHQNGEKVFKKQAHQKYYDNRPSFKERKSSYYQHDTYKEVGRAIKEQRNAGILEDAYGNNTFARNADVDRDHIIPKAVIDADPKQALSKNDPVDTANRASNIAPTTSSVNKSKKEKSTAKYIDWLKKTTPERRAKIERLQTEAAERPLSDKERKTLNKYIDQENVDVEKVAEVGRRAARDNAKSHLNYYASRDFLGTTAAHAAWAGGKMAAKQCVGMVLLELSVAVQEEIPAIVNRWREAPSWKEKLDFKELLGHVRRVLVETWERVRGRLKDFWHAAKDGLVAGVMSEIVTTVINIFTTTIKRVMRLVRNLWSGIVSALRILVLNPDNLDLEDKLAAVMRLLSVAVGSAVQPIVSEAIDKLMANVPLPSWLREPLAEFAGAAVGGVLSTSLLYAIEKSPVVQVVADGLRRAGAITETVCREVAALSGLAWQTIRNGVETLLASCASPAANLLVFAVCPPLGLAIHAVRTVNGIRSALGEVREEQALVRQEIDDLSFSLQTGLNSLQEVMRENTSLLRCVAERQDRQLAIMNDIRNDIRTGFAEVRQEIGQVASRTTEMGAVRDLQNELNQLWADYRGCAESMASGGMPPRRDLEAIERLASSILGKLQTSLDGQQRGAPARLPLLLSMAFAVGTWRDARAALDEPVGMCLGRAAALRDVVRKELVVLTDKATLWQLAREKAWLIEQHVLLHRLLTAMEAEGGTFSLERGEARVISDAAQARIAWNDGLQPARDLLEESVGQPSIDVLPLRRFEDAEAWATLAGLPMGVAITEVPVEQFRQRLGIPEDVPLGEASLRLMHAAVEITNDNQAAIAREIA